MMTAYEIETTNHHDAQREAKDRYSRDFGFDINYISVTSTRQLTEIGSN